MRQIEQELSLSLLKHPHLLPARPTYSEHKEVKGRLEKVNVERLLQSWECFGETKVLFVEEEKRGGMPKVETKYTMPLSDGPQPDMRWEVCKGGTNRGVLVRNGKKESKVLGFFRMPKYVGILATIRWVGSKEGNVLRVDLKEYTGFAKGMIKQPSIEQFGKLEEEVVRVGKIIKFD